MSDLLYEYNTLNYIEEMFEENNQITTSLPSPHELSNYLDIQQINLKNNLLYMHWGTNQINHYDVNTRQHNITTGGVTFN